jgi:glutamate carboxypeptidase
MPPNLKPTDKHRLKISEIENHLSGLRESIFSLLEEMVRIQSGTRNKAGVDAVGNLIQRTCRPLPVNIRVVEQPVLGNHLVLRTNAEDAAGGRILLAGHMDTVFPRDTDFNWYREDQEKSYGPGVCDMKGGLVTGIFALKALDNAGLLAKIPLTFVFNSDEEIGSPSSRDLIAEQARQSSAAFVLECGGHKGEIVTGRKGSLSFLLTVTGRAGHAAFAGKEKASAILELAHKTIALENLNDVGNGLSVNVGKITGGIGANTVAENARARVDCRFVTPEQKKELSKKIDAIGKKVNIPGTQTCIEMLSSRPPMPRCQKNRQLYGIVKQIADELGRPIEEEHRQGVSDANQIAAQGIPVVDGLGPVGGRDHSREEYMIKESLIQRVVLLTRCIIASHRRYAAGQG